MAKKGVINIVGDKNYPPFYFRKPDGRITGITPELLRWLEVELNLKIELHVYDLHEGMQSVLEGGNDVMCDLFYNKERDTLFDFTETLYMVSAYIYIPKERTDIKSMNDLKGKTVAIQKGDYAINFLKAKGIRCKIIMTNDFGDALDSMLHGGADAVVGDDPVIMYLTYTKGERGKIKRVGSPLYTAKSCLAVKGGNKVLLDILNKCIIYAEKKGVINRLSIKWFGSSLNIHKETVFVKYVKQLLFIIFILILVVFFIWLWNFRLQKALEKKTFELKESLYKLNKYKAQMENVLKSVNGYMYWGKINDKKEIIDWDSSDSLVRITGYEKETFRKQNKKFWTKLIYPDDLEKINKAFGELKKEGKNIIGLEYRIVTKGGKVKWLSENAIIVENKQTGEKLLQGICIDITESRALKNLLEQNKAYFKSLFDNLEEAVVIIGEDERIVEINRGFTKLFGYTRDEIVGKRYTYLKIPEDEKARFSTKLIKKRLINSEKISLETKRLNKDGIPIDVLIIASPIVLSGEIKGALAILVDTRERMKLINQIREERKRLTTILRSIGEAVIVTDKEGKVELINRIMEIGFGLDRDDIKGAYFTDILNTSVREKNELESALRKSVKNKEIVRLDSKIEIKGSKGKKYTYDVNISPVFNKKSEIKGVIIVLNDITELKELENTMIRAKNLESLGILAGGIAHDFNNYLTAILGNIEIAKMKCGGKTELCDLLSKVESATVDAKNLTMELLTFAKGDTNLKKITSIVDLIKETSHFILSGSNVMANLEVDDNLWNAVVDKGQIKNVISNLLINAEQAMPEGGIVSIVANNVILSGSEGIPLSPGKYIKIEIIDEGKGIPEEIIDNIFDPYFTTKKMGSGLGLATAHSIIKNHNGFISVKSEIDKGTKFTIYLPATEQIIKERKTVFNKKTDASAKILVMDDEEMIREVVGEMLKIIGYEADFAKDGEEAIAKYSNELNKGKGYDAVLLDLTIPGGMGGKEAVAKLLEIDPNAKCVIVSGYSTDVIINEYRKYGFKNVILKPFRMDELKSVLKEVLND